MGNPKISTFIVALIWVSFFSVIFALFLANMTVNYGVGYNESRIEVFDKLEELHTHVQQVEDETDIEQPSGALDLIGSYFNKGYQVLKTTGDSLDIFYSMLDQAFTDDSLGIVAGNSLKTAILSTVIILIFVGVFISAIVKLRI